MELLISVSVSCLKWFRDKPLTKNSASIPQWGHGMLVQQSGDLFPRQMQGSLHCFGWSSQFCSFDISFSGLPWGRNDRQLLGILWYVLFVELLSGGVWRSLDPEYIAESKSKESRPVGLLARDKVMRTLTQYVHTFDLRALSLLGLSTSYAAMLSSLVGKGHEDPMAMWNGSNMN